MRSALSVGHYIRPEIFELEQQRLFGRVWIFACLKTSVQTEHAFATRRIAGRSVLIQNCGKSIRAFENACPHRLMPIQTATFGQARMTCPYHGWVFNAEGKVKTIPKEESLYRFSSEERGALCLREYAVETVGELVFVNLDEKPLPITDQFSPELLERLHTISAYFSDISILFRKSNRIQRRVPFLLDLLEQCTGKYIYLLEGDDRWDDNGKCQSSIAALDAHPQHNLLFTAANIIDERSNASGKKLGALTLQKPSKHEQLSLL